MQLKSLELLFKTENKSKLYLIQKCWENKRRFCIRCESPKIYHLSEKRYRCARCRYTFQDFSGRWIGQLNLSAKQWLWILKLFELETTTLSIAGEVEISYPTALKATHLIRCAIIQASDNGEIFTEREWIKSCLGRQRTGRRDQKAAEFTPIFGILERNNKVKISILEDVSPKTLLEENVKAAKTGSIIYTDRLRNFDALMFYGYRHLDADHAKRMARTRVYIDSQEGFWSFAIERLVKFRGVSQRYFPLYLKEMEFRYNHRRDELYELLIGAITRLMPKSL